MIPASRAGRPDPIDQAAASVAVPIAASAGSSTIGPAAAGPAAAGTATGATGATGAKRTVLVGVST
jgi:hypothetical protein